MEQLRAYPLFRIRALSPLLSVSLPLPLSLSQFGCFVFSPPTVPHKFLVRPCQLVIYGFIFFHVFWPRAAKLMTDGGRTSGTEGRKDGEEEGEKIEGTAVKIEESSDGSRDVPAAVVLFFCLFFFFCSFRVVKRIFASTLSVMC